MIGKEWGLDLTATRRESVCTKTAIEDCVVSWKHILFKDFIQNKL